MDGAGRSSSIRVHEHEEDHPTPPDLSQPASFAVVLEPPPSARPPLTAEVKADPGSGLVMLPPVTADISRSRSSTTDGRFTCSAVLAPSSIDLGMFDKHGFISSISSIGESAPATGEPSSSQQGGYSVHKIVPPGEGTAAAANATNPGTTPIPTTNKEDEDAHSRPRKKSKGVTQFKVMKDKRPTPANVLEAPRAKHPRRESAGDVIAVDRLTKPKLDFDSPEVIMGSFSRARLIDNLRRLAKVFNRKEHLAVRVYNG
ncbi:unnamed protein product [Alopecurus aequalis]